LKKKSNPTPKTPKCQFEPSEVSNSQKVTKDGKCEQCPDYTKSDEDDGFASCKTPVLTPGCDSKKYITKTGMCVDCP